MTTTSLSLVVVLVAFLFLGCSDPKKDMRLQLDNMEAKPAATENATAKAMYDEISNFVAWLEAHPEESTPGMLARAKNLKLQRGMETGVKVVEGVVGKILKTHAPAGDEKKGEEKKEGEEKKDESFTDLLPSLAEVGEATGNVASFILRDEEREKKFACKDINGNLVDVTKEGFSKLCVR